MLPVECVVRGYITGSGWKDYQATGAVCGIELPAGLRESEQLPGADLHARARRPTSGHDEAIDFERAVELVGDRELAERVRDVSIALYEHAAEHARARGIILADTKFEFGLDADGDADARRRGAARRTPRASGPPTATSRAAASRASTSSTCATGRRHRLGQDAAGAGDPRRRRRSARARATSRPTSGSPASRSTRWLERTGAAMRARVLIRPKAGILDPQGQAVERALPALGFEGVAQRPRRPAGRARRRGPVAGAGDVRAAARQPADRGLRDRRSVDAREVRRRPLPRHRATRSTRCSPRARVGEAELLWHGDRDLQGVDAVIVPGGFSYGDYLRAGAIARFSPVMDDGRPSSRATAGWCSASATASRCCARPACCPGALLPNTSLRFICRQVDARGRQRRHAVHARVRRGRAAVDPGQAHDRPLLRARRRARPSSRPTARSCCATRPGQNSNGSLARHRRRVQRAGNVVGLMPHPEHAVDPLTGSADGLKLFESMRAHVARPQSSPLSAEAPRARASPTPSTS